MASLSVHYNPIMVQYTYHEKTKKVKVLFQGKVEQGHVLFNKALQKWVRIKGRNNWLVGVFDVNKEINDVPLGNHGSFSLYNLTY